MSDKVKLTIAIPESRISELRAAADRIGLALGPFIVTTVLRVLDDSTSVASNEREMVPATSSPKPVTQSKKDDGDELYFFKEPMLPPGVTHVHESAMQRRCRAGEFDGRPMRELRAAIAQEKLDHAAERERDIEKQAAYRKYRRDEDEGFRLQKEEQNARTTPEEQATQHSMFASFAYNPETGKADIPVEHPRVCGCARCYPDRAALFLRKVIAYHRERVSDGLPVYDVTGMRFTEEQVFADDYHPFNDRSPTPRSYPTPQEISLAEDITNVPSQSLNAALEERAALKEKERRKDFRVVKLNGD